MMKKLKPLIKYILIICAVSFNINLNAQDLISRDLMDYTPGTTKTPSTCTGEMGNLCSWINLAPVVRFNQEYLFDIPLIRHIDDSEINSISANPSVLDYDLDTFQIENQIRIFVKGGWDVSPNNDHYVQFNFHAKNISDYPAIDNQIFRINIIRDTLKVVTVLDISESMDSIIDGTTNSKFDILKDKVSSLVTKLSFIRIVPDSIGLTYFNSNVVQPSSENFPSEFNEISHPFQPPTSTTLLSNDLLLRTPEGISAMGEGLLDAKKKLGDNSPYQKQIVFLFSDGLQDTGNKVNLDGISFSNTTDSLNKKTSLCDSIIYITVSTTKAADVTPLMAAIANRNNGISLHIDGNSTEFQDFLDNQLDSILHNHKAEKVASRIIDLNPLNNSINIANDQNLTIHFNEDVNINSGSIFIMRSLDDSEFEEIDVTSGLVLGNGTSIITVNPTQDLESETEYYIVIDENAFLGVSGNNFAGITSSNYWTFTSEDSEKPSVILSADNDTTNTAEFDTYVNFSERIRGFSDSKISVTNGNVNSLSTTDSIDFIASITSISQGETDINVNEDQVTDEAGNMNTAADELTVTYYVPTSIEILKKAGISIYTNEGFVIVDFKKTDSQDSKSGDLEIYSLNGSLIKKEKLENSSRFKTYLNNQRGIYLVKLTLDNKTYYAKIQN
jgi:Bacterial Ig-like domain